MNADLEHLIVLQAQDLELRRLRQELDEAPRRVTAAQTARARAEVARAEANKSLAHEETLRRAAELDIASLHTKTTRLQQQMVTATSAAQITALEHEIAFAQQTIASLEDDELASLERTDSLDATRLALTSTLESTTAALAAERARTAQLTATHHHAITAIEAERSTLRARIAATPAGEAALSTYDRIAKAKGTAVSEAIDHKCSACQMMVRAQRWNDLTDRDPHSPHANTLFTCETCGRLLFFDPRRDAPVRWSPGERLGNASGTGPKPATSTSPPTKLAETA
jgi:predicted  nucleic acid-binding Zn-ribbon protein